MHAAALPLPRRAWLRMALAGSATLAGGAYLAIKGRPAAAAAPPEDVCIVAPALAWDGSGSQLAPRTVPAEARCPVCGMFPARQPRWAVQVIYADGSAHFLDSPLSLFHYLQRVERYAPGRRRADIAAIHVTEYETGRWLAAAQALFVHGSSLTGPMRSGNLPAVAAGENERLFTMRHGGQSLGFAALERELPAALQQLMPHRHAGLR